MRLRSAALSGLLLIAASTRAAGQQACEQLTGTTLDHATVTAAAVVAAGPFAAAPTPIAVGPLTLPAYCRVQGVARPTGDSEIKFEVWLPDPAAWNGNYEQLGNGGYAGTITPQAIAASVARGYAAAATDDGHVGPAPNFAIGHPEKVVDFGHRAVHLTAVHAKAIVKAYYGKAQGHSYFFGCSDGGREALMEAQRYPEDFDGIIAGAPANDWTHLLTSAVWNWSALTKSDASQLTVAKLGAIQKAVVAACDRLDGVADGLLDDPRKCRFQPKKLLCRGADGPDCLTADQVAALEKIYGGPKSPKTGRAMFPPVVPGTEAVPGNWNPWLVGPAPTGLPLQAWFGTTFYQTMVYEDLKWDYKTMDFDRDLARALAKAAPSLDAADPNLRPFRARGGKLIQFHGWGDAAIPAGSSIDYFERVRRAIQRTEDFYRLYLVPAMGHCAGGFGPNDFGNLGLAGPSRNDPTTDIHAALVNWVENGVAPGSIVAAGVRPGEPPFDPTKGVKLTRPLCPYPSSARYRGHGSTDDAASFVCSAGGR